MRLVCKIALFVLTLSATTALWANTDPQLIFDPDLGYQNGLCVDPSNNIYSGEAVSSPFSFSTTEAPSTATPFPTHNAADTFFCFSNGEQNSVWHGLSVDLSGQVNAYHASEITCQAIGNLLKICDKVAKAGDNSADPIIVALDFFQGNGLGIGSGATFSFNLAPPPGCTSGCNWDGSFGVSVVTTPEPASFVLFASGGMALWSQRRRYLRRPW